MSQQSYFAEAHEHYKEQRWRRRLLAARLPRSLVVRAGTLAALGGSTALGQLLAACAASGSGKTATVGITAEGSYKYSRFPAIEKYNFRNLPWPTTPYVDGTIIFRHDAGANRWDFARLSLAGWGCIMQALLAKRYGPGVDMNKDEIVGRLADTWGPAPDYSYYDFHIRPNTYFHDIAPVNGRLCTAEDVKYSLEVMQKLHVSRADLEGIDRIEVRPDRETVRLHLKKPVLWMDAVLANSDFMIFAQEHFEGPKDRWDRQPIGTGPFKMVLQDLGSKIESVRHERFNMRHETIPGQLPFAKAEKSFQLTDQAARVAAFRSGQLDTYRPTDPVEVDDILATHPNTIIQAIGQGQSSFWALNLRDPLFQDVRVRRALSLAVNRQQIIDLAYGGWGAGTTRISWTFLERDDPFTVAELETMSPWYGYDPARAKALLAEAGYPNGFEMELMIGASPSNVEVMMQQFLAEIGVRLRFNQVESVVRSQALVDRTYKHAIGDTNQTGFNPLTPVRYFYHPDSPRNIPWIDDPVTTDLVNKTIATLDFNEQQRLIHQINAREMDQIYRLPLASGYYVFARQPWFHNLASAATGHFDVFSHHQVQWAWIDDTAPADRRGRKA